MREESYLVLGIETSCDETSAAVVKDGREIKANVIASQVDWHQKFGGVVPEIASRKHLELINPVIREAMEEAGLGFSDLDGVAVTCGPGLVGGLLVGVAAAKSIALAYGLPLVGVNHILGHIYANFLARPDLETPVICLTVSGGHTDLLLFKDLSSYKILGRTRDDAAGEALDKIGRVMGLPYPGGPEIEKLAAGGNPEAIDLPRPLPGDRTYDFSFSGLKTAVLNYLNQKKQKGEAVNYPDLAASFQQAIFDVLKERVIRSVEELDARTVILSGGVAANSTLRRQLEEELAPQGVDLFYPPQRLCTDNAAMIATAGHYMLRDGYRSSLSLNAYPNLQLDEDKTVDNS
ncbi:MAG: tRNA (adenosine(37)-N6)-threonylcarbamoyltransferase complex transferase subunit TsaD [Halanaerobium sp.]|nr:tRNA (adenosine(37)-N6)-threonylcarbamoyltransferase complex transferase subunit TsaD [Halanaerobium sp.]